MNAKNFPFLACASVFYVPFFPSRCIYCFFTQSLLIKVLPSKLSVVYQATSGQNGADIFHIWASSVPGMTFSDILFFAPGKYLILLLIRHTSCRWCLVLLQGLVGTYSAQLPFDMMSFHFGCMSCKRKGKKKKTTTQLAKTELRNANWLRWNPSGGRRKVSPHIFDQSGQIEGWRRGGSDWDWKSSKSALCLSNL